MRSHKVIIRKVYPLSFEEFEAIWLKDQMKDYCGPGHEPEKDKNIRCSLWNALDIEGVPDIEEVE